MTEKEKMLAGEIYDANSDKELERDRTKAKILCHEYNQLSPAEPERQRDIIKRLFGKTAGDKFLIQPTFWCDYGYNIEVGENFFANHNTVILDCAKVIFGNNVLVGPNCGFYTAEHPLDIERRNKGLEYAKPITVGDNVWFGAGVQVLPGVTIGDGAVIGAGSVVAKDVPPNVVVAGVPARIIKKLAGCQC